METSHGLCIVPLDTRGCYELVGWIALLAKPHQARRKPQGMAGPCSRLTTQHGAVFAATHLGRGRFSRSPRHSSLQYARYSALLPPWPRENPLPSLPPHKFITASRPAAAGTDSVKRSSCREPHNHGPIGWEDGVLGCTSPVAVPTGKHFHCWWLV
jgi:hypothetical protein